MRLQSPFGILLIAIACVVGIGGAQSLGQRPSTTSNRSSAKSVRLEDLTWPQAEQVLTPETIVLIPIGAASKEHGPHLLLSNDLILAQYFTAEVMHRTPVVVAPVVNYHYYPAFVNYAGATTLRLETARDLIVDICHGLARFGPKKFYALNTGVSTIRALQPAVEILAQDGITLQFTDILKAGAEAEKAVTQQREGTHADEIETSMMLFISPKSVNMAKASKDFPTGRGILQHADASAPRYSPSGIYGDATLATRAKGERVV
ncbi:MAG: creatininase family protein, partial [Bryobacteraceae bacterium]